MLAARVTGDYLQTAAIFDEQMNVLSLVTDPNDYLGPGTGYDPTPDRQAEIDGDPPGAFGRRPPACAGRPGGVRPVLGRGGGGHRDGGR